MDRQRGTAQQRGYTSRGHQRFRIQVLENDHMVCRLCGDPATIADHYPHTRKELIAKGLDPDDPQYGRALCKHCHDRHTATHQSFNRR